MKGTGLSTLDRISRRLWPLDPPALYAKARRDTGLSDFGDPPIEPALPILARSLDLEADLHPLGRFLMWSHLVDLLRLRLRLTAGWRSLPLPQTEDVRRPLFITGMPRSGSTFLHELLAADPGNRAPRTWEIMFPLPAETAVRRIRRAETQLWWFRCFAPEADRVHPLRAQSPQECEAIHSYTFLSEEFLSTCWVPSYEQWLRSADLAPAYLWQRRFLHHLRGSDEATRWVLKSPDHAHSIGALLATFPDAMIVQTHRDPQAVLQSSLGLIEVLHGVFARSAGYQRRAHREVRVLAEAMDRLLQFRTANPALSRQFFDLGYAELTADPLGAVARIYDHWGVRLTTEATLAMRRLVGQRSRYQTISRRQATLDLATQLQSQMWRFERYRARFEAALRGA